MSAYKRAQQTYERLRAEQKAQAERDRAERERQKQAMEFNREWRKKFAFDSDFFYVSF